MSFSIDDYERVIARIFQEKEGKYYPIGTGFLIAPGYVMTCAHVVLQAIGIEDENKYSETKDQPDKDIFLDFPIIENCRKVPLVAKVVEWIPYENDDGDVAVLKLVQANDYVIKPLPLVEVKREEVETDKYSIYGFPQEEGTRSDAYKPKSNVAGGRWQLCKVGDPKDETIQPGFSGGPIWNDTQKSIVGMVATARFKKDEIEKAFAITTKKLSPILKKIKACYLIDSLEDDLKLFNEEEANKLRRSINNTLQYCNPSECDTKKWQKQIEKLNYLPPAIGWKNEGRLVQWVMALAKIDETPRSTYIGLKNWINEICRLDFNALLDRITEEMKDRKTSCSNQCEHLLVSLKSAEKENPDLYSVSIWPIANLDSYNTNSPAKPFALNQEKTLDEIPKFIYDKHREKCRQQITTIHLFVPRDLLSYDIDMKPFGTLNNVLGSKYPLLIRTNLSVHPVGEWLRDDWQRKWEDVENSLNQSIRDIFEPIDCQYLNVNSPDNTIELDNLFDTIKVKNALVIQNCSSLEYLFDLMSDEGVSLPIAVWCREPELEGSLVNLLDQSLLREFPTKIQAERRQARRNNNAIGQHLSLMWENPNILPPDMQFNQENL